MVVVRSLLRVAVGTVWSGLVMVLLAVVVFGEPLGN